MKREISAILTIATRDVTKLLRDRTRLLISFIFPIIFIGVLGGSLQANLSDKLGYNFITFTFVGVIGQTLFQSTASGIISLIEDRENDFSQEIFVSPISRYSIIIGKIIGETLVSYTLVSGVLIMGVLFGVRFTLVQIIMTLSAGLLASFLGGAFGILILSNLSTQRTANQLFPFIMFPQFFLAGVFNPIKVLPLPLFILSRIMPMTYAVDLVRNVYYWGMPEYDKVVLYPISIDLMVIAIYSLVGIVVGTALFIRNEKNR